MPEDHPPGNDSQREEPATAGSSFATGSAASGPAPQLVSSARIVYCTHCGSQLDGLRIGDLCPSCGQPVGSAQTGVKTNGRAIAALVLGVCSFVGCMMYAIPGIACGILAIVFGNQVRRGVASGEMHASSLGMANAGRTCGIVGLCLSLLGIVLIIAYFVFIFTMLIPMQQQQMQQNYPSPTQPAPAFP